MLTATTSTIDWSVIQERAERHVQRVRRRRYVWPALAVAFVAVQSGAKQWADGGMMHRRLIGFTVSALALGALYWKLARDASRKLEANRARKDALQFYRDTLDGSIRALKFSLWLVPGLVILMTGLWWLTRDPEVTAAAVLFGPLGLGVLAWSFFVRLPQLRRERDELR